MNQARKALPDDEGLARLAEEAALCVRCLLYRDATQWKPMVLGGFESQYFGRLILLSGPFDQ
ncbi:MAG: hypothetical protein ACT4O2_04200 [Beijerinckiaceae bacterium]